MVSNARLLLPLPDRPVMTTSRSRGRSTSISRRLCSRAPRTEMMSGSPAGTAFGARAARGELDTVVATRGAAGFFPFAAGCAPFVVARAGDFAVGFAGAFAGRFVACAAGAASGAPAAFRAVFFAAGRAGAGCATFFAALRSAMAAPYPRAGSERTYVPGSPVTGQDARRCAVVSG